MYYLRIVIIHHLSSTAPCLPNNVTATLDCQVNSFKVKWNGTANDGPFSALAIGSDGSRVSCNTPNTQCTIMNLKCGFLYSIIVTTANVDCGVIHGSDYKIHSGSYYSRFSYVCVYLLSPKG